MIEVAILAGVSTLTVGALAVTVSQTAKQSQFLYANARIIARSSLMIEGQRLQKMQSLSSLPEIVNSLKDTDYYPYLESIDKNSLLEFNMAIEKGLTKTIQDLKELSPKKFQPVFDAYTRSIEATIIKTFFRARFAQIELPDAILKPIGSINPSLLKHLEESKTVADMSVVLKNTDYADLFDTHYETVEEFDVALDQKVLALVDDTLQKLKVYERKVILEIFERRTIVRNILRLLKFRLRQMPKEKQMQLVSIPSVDMQQVCSAKTLAEFVECFAHTKFYEPLKKGFEEYESHQDYYGFEKELLAYHYRTVAQNELMHNIGPYPLISYMTRKKRERRNLLILAKSAQQSAEQKQRLVIA